MKKITLALAMAGMLAVTAAHAASVTVNPWLAPNAFGSPSFAGAESNAVQAEYQGVSSLGSGPTKFQVQSNVTTAQGIVTGFPSWMGVADPGNAFGPAYANELGNRMTFALSIIAGVGQQVSIDQLSFSAHSTDPFNYLDFAYGAGSYNYGTGYMGVLKGTDGVLGTPDDVFITSGPSNQLVDAIFGRGTGNSGAAYCSPCTVEQQQAAIDLAASYPGTAFQFTGTYTIDGDSGSGTFNISPPAETPLPGALAMFGGGLGVIGLLARRRKQKALKAQAA